MRSLRLLLLVALVALAGTIYGVFNQQRSTARNQRPNPPAPMPLDTKASALDYEWGQSDNGLPRVRVHANGYKLTNVQDNVELVGLELQIFDRQGTHYDLIKSPNADFSQQEGKLYSPGDCEITLNVPFKEKPTKPLTVVKTSGIHFDTKSGRAETDRNTAFTFAGGEGVATGAAYDPQTRELHLLKDVVVNLVGKTAKSQRMKVESGELFYRENDQVVTLAPWSRMTRGQTVIDATNSTVKLRDKAIDWIDAQKAHGIDKEPKKELQYAGDLVHVQYNDYNEMEKLQATGHAWLVSHGPGSDTKITGNRVDLFFTMNAAQESELSSASVNGNGRIESVPVPDPKGKTGDTKIIVADSMDLQMKPGGKELNRVNTHAPGSLEFLPHQAARHRRVVKGTRMDIEYAANNEVKGFHTVDAETQTDPSDEEKKRKKNNAVAYTSSKSLDATFDDKGQLANMVQRENFRYAEGERKAQSDTATFDNSKNTMLLERGARMSDATGSTSGDAITLQQSTGDFQAAGHVATTRIPERPASNGKSKNSSMLDDEEPMQGTADNVVSADRNKQVHYSGNAVVWQTSNRITADRIDIDREKKMLVADGQVVTQFLDSDKNSDSAPASVPAPPGITAKPASLTALPAVSTTAPKDPIFTVVRAQHMVYTDSDRLAVYNGNVSFARPTLTVKSDFLKAFLNENNSDADSRINKAFSDGKVVIMDTSLDRQRVSSSEHAEYYTEEGKIILTGGSPRLDDPKRGNQEGQKITYYTDDEKLETEKGSGSTPVKSHLKRRKP